MSTGWNRLSAEALRHEVEHCSDLLARHVELLDNLVDAEILEVLDDRGHGQARALEHPGAAHLTRDALDGWTLGPVTISRPGPLRPCRLSFDLMGFPAGEDSVRKIKAVKPAAEIIAEMMAEAREILREELAATSAPLAQELE